MVNNENENEQQQQQVEQNPAEQYASEIAKLKANSVSKERYEELLAQNKVLSEALANGQAPQPEHQQPSKDELVKSYHELRKALQDTEGEPNIEYIQTALNFRKAAMDLGHPDPFTAKEHETGKTPEEDFETAQQVADMLQSCLDDSNGDNSTFTALVQSRMQDTASGLAAYKKFKLKAAQKN